MRVSSKSKAVFLQYFSMLLILPLLLSACTPPPEPSLRAGLRSSSYGISPFPNPDWWLNATSSMADPFESAAPAVVWIVGNAQRGGECWLSFPMPEGKDKSDYENIRFAHTDRNEDYLKAFDETGVRVWLQIEPAAADVETLFALMLDRYASHPSVIGVGVDVEWFQQEKFHEGKAVTDVEAQAWVKIVQAYNADYQVFMKHWLSEKMPLSFRDGLMFLNDSQGFETQDEMLSEFSSWGKSFEDASVGFQYGYASDRSWWKELTSPPQEIGFSLLENVPNTTDLYWVDFTAEEIWQQE